MLPSHSQTLQIDQQASFQQILGRQLRPGDRVITDRLARELGVSRIPVRQVFAWAMLPGVLAALALRLLDHVRERMTQFQEETGHLYNLEATPAEGTTYRFAKEDRKRFPGILQAGTPEQPYYTNSSQLPVGFTDDPFDALERQDERLAATMSSWPIAVDVICATWAEVWPGVFNPATAVSSMSKTETVVFGLAGSGT